MRIFVLFLTVVFAQPALAVDLEPWQEKANEIIMQYKRITHVDWEAPDLLYVWSDNSNVHWWTILDQHVCLMGLSHEMAGRPEGLEVAIFVRNNKTEGTMESYRCR